MDSRSGRVLLAMSLAAVLTIALVATPSVAAGGVSTIEFVSGTDWRTKPSFAQNVCLNASAPVNCPPGATVYGHPAAGWQADLGPIPGATWIWAPSVDGRTMGADGAAFAFRKSINVPGQPTAGAVHVAVDDLARIVVNGSVVGEWGSVTDQQAAGIAQNSLASFDITPFLRQGKNAVVVWAFNGPSPFAGCTAPCTYAENPAGVVFGGSITYQTEDDAAPTTPELLTPIGNASIPQNNPDIGCPLHPTAGYGHRIVFDWTDSVAPAGIAGYEIIVEHVGSLFPLIDTTVGVSELTYTACGAFAADPNLDSWRWRVRAVDVLGSVSEWTDYGLFRFEPCRIDGIPCSA
jgi:hypothetical protein